MKIKLISLLTIGFTLLVIMAFKTNHKPTLYIIGDSTIAKDGGLIEGWGVPIATFFDTAKIVVENDARGGRSSRSFRYEGLWQKVVNKLQPGDYVLMQFGHNDGGKIDGDKYRASLKGIGDEEQEITRPDGSKEMVHTYGWYMRKYIDEAKAKGAIPIVCSPIPRNEWKDGKVIRNKTNYGGWAREVAHTEGAYFIDLNTLIANKYDQMGAEVVKQLFPQDHTHTSPTGATLNARMVVKGIRHLKDCPLKQFLRKEDSSFLITNYGAVGDGTTLNTKAIQNTIDWCAAEGGGTVIVPSGIFLSGAIFLKQGVNLMVEKNGVLKGTTNLADYPLVATRWEGTECQWTSAFINVFNMTGFHLSGEGTIDGSGEAWVQNGIIASKQPGYSKLSDRERYGRPRLIAIQDCKNVTISGLHLHNEACWCLFILYSQNITVQNLTIHAEHNIPMSDGIDIDSSKKIHVNNCDIDDDDDCISIKSGKDAEGRRIGRASQDILIEKCTFRYGGGGVAMGSEMSGGIKNVEIHDCVAEDGNWAPIRFKSQPSRGGVVENITYRNIILKNTRNAFDFNMAWRMVHPKPASNPLPVIRNIHIINVSGTVQSVGDMHGLAGSPISNVEFKNCNITAQTGFILDHVKNINLSGLTLKVAKGESIIRKN
ncbi:glycosyl hydrolase family 28 protein [Microbacter margulisiae]|uniref:Polygalacturonase/lysophospholipase L1-like esterase n=1 Tax=Microbacter margulisiae TaxID=1350067 RepID=A0A7W5DQ08_9PORP|nr:glycosyl hydrolase family 28 protein [Microbacter margulisiae]MBB3186959.1 polygalacturonase/lysophospholipase L1-like esterase [Microbacter margulisiae]